MSTIQHRLITLGEFERMPEPMDGSRLELIRGEVVVMPPAKGKHGIYCQRIGRFLGNHVEPTNLGWVTTNDSGVVFERDPDTVRGPDVAFWSIGRQPEMPEGYFLIPPDIAVEVLSPDDRWKDVRVKIQMYLNHNIPLVWLVDPETRTVTVYRGTMRGTKLDASATLEGGAVLPGFACKVADVFT